MKVRNGFVSNSSSSSFILGIAKVTDEKKLREYIDENKLQGLTIKKVKDINDSWDVSKTETKISMESFTYDIVEVNYESEEDTIVYYEECEGDDSDFWNEDDGWGEYDYDIDLDFFSQGMIDVYDLFLSKDAGIVDANVTYGAGRNG